MGERIPCASMFEESKERPQFRRFRIHPYCWATDQNTVLEEKIREIDEKEWELLAQALIEYETLTGDEIKKVIAGEKLDKSDEGPVSEEKRTRSSVPEI